MPKANSGYPMQMTVDLTAKVLVEEENSKRDNGLQVPLMIEWK